MTRLLQGLLFNVFGERFDQKDIEGFSANVSDLQFTNTVLKEYESCWFRDGPYYLRASTYLVPVSETESARMFAIVPMEEVNEMNALKKEFGDTAEDVEVYTVSTTLKPVTQHTPEGDENIAKENNNTESSPDNRD